MNKTTQSLGWILATSIVLAGTACGSDDGPPPLDVGSTPGDGRADGVGPETEIDPTTNTPDVFVPEKFRKVLSPGEDPNAVAKRYIEDNKASLGVTDPAQLSHEQTVTEDGTTSVTYQQTVGGIPVFGSHVGVHFNEDGEVVMVDGPFIPGLEAIAAQKPNLDPAAAAAAGAAGLVTEEPGTTKTEQVGTGSLVIYTAQEDERLAPALAYRMQFNSWELDFGPILNSVFIDAMTGAVLDTFQHYAEADHQAQGDDTIGGRHRFPAFDWGANFRMGRDNSKPFLYVGRNLGDEVPLTWVPEEAATLSGPWDGQAVEAIHFTIRTMRFYEEEFRWSSYDNKNGPLWIAIRYRIGPDRWYQNLNASAGGQGMHFTVGNDQGPALTRCLDVVAHEYTHMVTENTSKLVYRRQSGAINESMSDVFGAIIERAAQGAGPQNFLIGEDSINGGWRSMRKPAAHEYGADPDHWKDREAFKPAKKKTDWGHVHSNSALPNQAFALIVGAGTNDTSGVTVANDIGWDRGRRLWWKTQRALVHENAGIIGMARRQILLAKRWKGIGGLAAAKTITCAWRAIGVITPETSKKFVGEDCGAVAGAGGG